jgi:ABC-2 type transport system permease protein
MRATFRAELVKLLRPRVLVLTGIVTALFSIGGTAVVLATVGPHSNSALSLTVTKLASAGGGTQIFRAAASYAGWSFLFAVFVGCVAVEFGRGTMRTMLLRQPRRLALLSGKLGAIFAFTATALAAGEVLGWVTARIDAPSRHIDTSAWTNIHAAGAALSDYGILLVWAAGYLVLATALAVLTRSLALGLGIGIAWFGPFEHIVQDSGWAGAARIFPGLSLEAFLARGTPNVSAGYVLVVIALYGSAAAITAALTFTRWDVTG